MCAAGCGGSGDRLRVSAASSLSAALGDRGDIAASFAGSDELAAQIRAGARPDVYLAANTELPAALHRDGLVDRPVVFAANRLVLAVPVGGGAVHSLHDLLRDGVTLAIGSPSVPVGSYTRALLGRLPGGEGRRILGHVRSSEPDVAGIVAKLAAGAVDAGFVYRTDVRAARGKLRAIPLPVALRPDVAYAGAVVRGTAHPRAAREFLDSLRHGAGARALRAAGFLPAP